MEGRPWPEWKGKPITANTVARLLRDFAIAPKQIRFGSQNLSGYELSAFDDAFERYLFSAYPSTSPTSPTNLKSEQNPQHQGPTAGSAIGLSSAKEPYETSDVGGVGVESATPEGNSKDRDQDDDYGDCGAPWELTI